MKFILTLAILASLSSTLLASDQIEGAKRTVTGAITNSFSILDSEQKLLNISLEILDINSLACEVFTSREVVCIVDVRPAFKKSIGVDLIGFYVNSESGLIESLMFPTNE